LSTLLPRNRAVKRRLRAEPNRRRLANLTDEVYVQLRRRFVRRVDSVRFPALTWTETWPVVHAWLGVTPAGSVMRPVSLKEYGARVSRAGVSREDSGAANASTVTARMAVAV
jgi:hypothetical protein